MLTYPPRGVKVSFMIYATIKKAYKATGWSLRQFSKETGVDRKRLREMLNKDTKSLSWPNTDAVFKALGIVLKEKR